MSHKKGKRRSKGLKFKVGGPGIAKALQEAVNAEKDLVTVPLYSKENGRIARIGYFLADKGQPIPADWRTKLKWLNESEVTILYSNTDTKSRKAELEATYWPPERFKKKGKEFLITLDLFEKALRIRNVFKFHRRSIVNFVIQIEAFDTRGKSSWEAILRYDCAHGYLHRDLIYLDGRKEKEKLKKQKFEKAIVIIVTDLKNNLRQWLAKLGYDKLLNVLPSDMKIEDELERSEKFLLDLIKHPEKISKRQSTYKHIYYHSIYTPLP